MPFLYEKIDTLREVGVSKELPKYIPENLNPNFELRPYQNNAFENFITYFESDKLCQKPTQTLFRYGDRFRQNTYYGGTDTVLV